MGSSPIPGTEAPLASGVFVLIPKPLRSNYTSRTYEILAFLIVAMRCNTNCQRTEYY